jgi:hypothetical protein
MNAVGRGHSAADQLLTNLTRNRSETNGNLMISARNRVIIAGSSGAATRTREPPSDEIDRYISLALMGNHAIRAEDGFLRIVRLINGFTAFSRPGRSCGREREPSAPRATRSGGHFSGHEPRCARKRGQP